MALSAEEEEEEEEEVVLVHALFHPFGSPVILNMVR